ncbi:hypothetical protein [Alloalcanivorax profundimaris]|uniref:hypothetical protein n=1 Tax=Alloalcanivorax profundimaris TaxID=2735259 RepID=UPI00188740BF|nr:hypothetical protein [Alloalcanivorax profundimaris]MBF1802560.1 hypothetical protein [Alloalcanivorax profundimaris]MCQ6263570.1 hypothetical protein [Alcanivorax sp. MM125-6]
MSGKDRLLLAGHPHYLMRKSADNQPVFLDEADCNHCLGDMRELSAQYELAVHAYCLLPQGLHVVATPREDPAALSRFMKALSCRASLRRKNLHGRDSAWEVRYRSSPIEPSQWLLTCMCYVERLPVVHELAPSAYHYRRSSYRMRLGKTGHYWLKDPEEYTRLGGTLEERAEAYRMYMSSGLDTNDERAIEAAVKQCKLIGSVRFIQEVCRRYGLQGGK